MGPAIPGMLAMEVIPPIPRHVIVHVRIYGVQPDTPRTIVAHDIYLLTLCTYRHRTFRDLLDPIHGLGIVPVDPSGMIVLHHAYLFEMLLIISISHSIKSSTD